MSSEDEFDTIPDEFDGLDFDAIPDLAIIVPTETIDLSNSTIPTRPASANSSSRYSCDDDIDESFLVELDAIEGRLTQGIRESTNTSSHPIIMSRFFGIRPESPASNLPPLQSHLDTSPLKMPLKEKTVDIDFPPRTSRKRGHSGSSPAQVHPHTKKGKAEPNDGVRQILEGFEDEITCPICCDIFVAAHLGNPCGHSWCGQCGLEWISQNKRSPTCAVCRTKLFAAAPMIPNFALDNTVDRHLQALAANGQEEWKPGGIKISEWNIKKEKWKKDSASRAAETAKKSNPRTRRQTRVNDNIVDVDDADDLAAWLVPDDDVDDEYYDEALELFPPPLRLQPRRHRGTR